MPHQATRIMKYTTDNEGENYSDHGYNVEVTVKHGKQTYYVTFDWSKNNGVISTVRLVGTTFTAHWYESLSEDVVTMLDDVIDTIASDIYSDQQNEN